VTITAEKLVKPGGIRLKGQLGYSRAALGALPVAFEHWPLETTSILIVVIRHFVNLFTTYLDSYKMARLLNKP
jgi:hypothetical protein